MIDFFKISGKIEIDCVKSLEKTRKLVIIREPLFREDFAGKIPSAELIWSGFYP